MTVVFSSCKEKEKLPANNIDHTEKIKRNDSLVIIAHMPKKTITAISTLDSYLNFKEIVFANKSDSLKKVIKSIPRYHNTLTLHHLFFYNNDVINQFYHIDEYTDTIELVLGVKYRFENHKKNVDSIYHRYQDLANKIRKNKKEITSELKEELDSVYNSFHRKFDKAHRDDLKKLNDIHYYDKLLMLYPESEEVDKFITTLETTTASVEFRSLLINYMKNRVNLFDYNILNEKSKIHKQILALAHFNFLRLEKNQGKKQYQSAIDWLQTTELYKKDSPFIKKEITPLSSIGFKEKLKKLKIYSTSDGETSFSKIAKQNQSPYYVIDFWATWCAPCIEGVWAMKNMQIPKNVKIISISLDRVKDKSKWKTKTKELGQSITYWLDEEQEESKAFLKFIELQSIPRYILIDKNLNLVDQAFHHPHESEFIAKLRDIRNHKFW